VRRIVLFAALIATAFGSLSAGWWLRGHMAIDDCLDAGGRWEYAGSYCVGAPFEDAPSSDQGAG
jgi:hypothetical protein